MHIKHKSERVLVILSCDFDSYDGFDFGTGDIVEDKVRLEACVKHIAFSLRLAGGDILSIGKVEFHELAEFEEKRTPQVKHLLKTLLPGFALIDRTKDLELHFKELESSNTETELLDAWLDFLSLKAIAVKSSDANGNENDATWVFVPKPADGWIVPLQVGYKGISKLYEPGQIENARDVLFPFRFVEAIYSVGSWVAPYRLNKIEELLWQYEVKNDWYLCRNVCDNA